MFATKCHSQAYLIFVGKVGSQPVQLSSLRGSTLISSNLDCEFYVWVEVTKSSKHSSLLKYGTNYGRKRFYSRGPWREFEKPFSKILSKVKETLSFAGKPYWRGRICTVDLLVLTSGLTRQASWPGRRVRRIDVPIFLQLSWTKLTFTTRQSTF